MQTKRYQDLYTKINYYDIETTKEGKYSVGAVLLNKHYRFFFHQKEFVDWLKNIKTNKTIYIHNLKFEMEFHFTELLKVYLPSNKRDVEPRISFTIDRMNNIYGVHIRQHGIKIDILDYFKIMPFKLSKIGETIGYPKGEIDYKILEDYQTLDEVPSDVIKYLKRDLEIMQKSYERLPKMKIKSTIASTSYENWRKVYQKKYVYEHFTKHLKDMPLNYLRNWYRGGIVLYDGNKKYQNLGRVYVYDFNSLYPSIMLKENLPYGECLYERPSHTKSYMTFLAIKIDHAYAKYIPWYRINNQYPPEFKNITIYVTKKEWKLFQESYLISQYQIVEELYFKTKWSFHKYINYWYNYKKNAKNKMDYQFAKLMLNSLYGKFGQNYIREIKVPVQQNTKTIGNYNGWEFVKKIQESRPKFYLPLAIAICAEARCKFLEFYLRHKKDIVYGDTDSFFSTVKYDYNSDEIGKLKYEGHYDDFILVRKKGYIFKDMNEILKFKLSGFRHHQEGKLAENMTHLKMKKIKDGYVFEDAPFQVEDFNKLPLDKLN